MGDHRGRPGSLDLDLDRNRPVARVDTLGGRFAECPADRDREKECDEDRMHTQTIPSTKARSANRGRPGFLSGHSTVATGPGGRDDAGSTPTRVPDENPGQGAPRGGEYGHAHSNSRPRPRRSQPIPTAGRRFGYGIAIAINIGLIVIVRNLLEWDWVPFLTGDFDRLVGIVTFSLVASAVVNLFWIAYDRAWFKSLGQLALDVITLAVTVQTYRVFPFDLSSGWETTGKVMLVLLMVVVGIATVVELVKLMTGPIREVAAFRLTGRTPRRSNTLARSGRPISEVIDSPRIS